MHALTSAMEVDPTPLVVATTEVAHTTKHLVRTVEVAVVQEGPVRSAELAGGHIKRDEPVIFLDCDNWYYPGVLKKFAETATSLGVPFAVLTADRGSLVGDFGGVTPKGDVVEAHPDVATCFAGAYYFGNWQLFKARACGGVPANGTELKFSDILPRRNPPAIGIPGSWWIPLGTAEQLQAADVRFVKLYGEDLPI